MTVQGFTSEWIDDKVKAEWEGPGFVPVLIVKNPWNGEITRVGLHYEEADQLLTQIIYARKMWRVHKGLEPMPWLEE